MIESLWSCMLILSALNRRARPLAFVLGGKALLNYAAAYGGLWLMPPLIDLAAGGVGVVLAMRFPRPFVGGFLAATFVIAPIVHAWHWGLWANGIWVGVQYWQVMLGLFTAQALALALPEAQDRVRAIRHNRRFARRRALAGVDGTGRGSWAASRR